MYKDLEIKFGLEPGILPRQVCGDGDVEHLKFVLIVLKWCNEKIRLKQWQDEKNIYTFLLLKKETKKKQKEVYYGVWILAIIFQAKFLYFMIKKKPQIRILVTIF